MNDLCLKTTLKLLFGRKTTFFLTISGILLPLLGFILLWEGMNAIAAASFSHLQNFDPSGVLIQTEGKMDLTDLVHSLKQAHLPFDYTLQYASDLHLNWQGIYEKTPLQINLDVTFLSGKISGGYLPYETLDTLYESKIIPLYSGLGQTLSDSTERISGKQSAPTAKETDNHTSIKATAHTTIEPVKEITDKRFTEPIINTADKAAKSYYSGSLAIPCILEQSTCILLFQEEDPTGKFFSFSSDTMDLAFYVCAVIEDLPGSAGQNLRLNRDLLFSDPTQPVYTSRSLFIPSRFEKMLTQETDSSGTSVCCIHFSEKDFPEGLSILQKTDFHAGYSALFDYETVLRQTTQQIRSWQSLIIPLFFLMMTISGLMIMNTMFFSVRERTKEIGIRRAVGAGTKKIILQFLFEGFLIGTLSAALACMLSLVTLSALSFVMLRIIGYDLVFSIHLQTIFCVFFFSVSLTLLFSFLPALQAAKTDPSVSFLAG